MGKIMTGMRVFLKGPVPGIRKGLLPAVFAVLFLAGCAGPLAVSYNPRPPVEPVIRVKEPARILVSPFEDRRPEAALAGKDRRTIGRITVLVSDMSDKELTLSEDISAIVTGAFTREFSAAGFKVSTEGDPGDFDFVLTGEVKAFRLDIGPRDEIDLEITPRLIDAKSQRIVWSEVETEKGDRFAGVTGNSRASISSYISYSLSRVIRRTMAEAAPSLTTARAAIGGRIADDAAKGRLVVTTEPARGKVYLGDVYYGLTPLDAEVEPGVYELTVRIPGFKDGREKISVRKGQSTELEMKLEKE